MSSKGRFVWSRAGYRDANNSPDVKAEVDRVAQDIKARADSMLPSGAAPFEADTQEGKRLAHAMVKTPVDDSSAGFLNRRAQASGNILLKAVGS